MQCSATLSAKWCLKNSFLFLPLWEKSCEPFLRQSVRPIYCVWLQITFFLRKTLFFGSPHWRSWNWTTKVSVTYFWKGRQWISPCVGLVWWDFVSGDRLLVRQPVRSFVKGSRSLPAPIRTCLWPRLIQPAPLWYTHLWELTCLASVFLFWEISFFKKKGKRGNPCRHPVNEKEGRKIFHSSHFPLACVKMVAHVQPLEKSTLEQAPCFHISPVEKGSWKRLWLWGRTTLGLFITGRTDARGEAPH